MGFIIPDEGTEDYVLGKPRFGLHWLALKIAVVIGLAIYLTFASSYLIELIRLESMIEEVNNIAEMSYKDSVQSFQNVNIKDYLYVGSGATLSPNYSSYLNELTSTANSLRSSELLAVVNYLKLGSDGTGRTRSEYTPLSFGLSYLDIDEVKATFDKNVRDRFELASGNSTSNSDLFNDLFIGGDRFRVLSTDVELVDLSVYDVTDISSNQSGLTTEENKRRKNIFAKVYGTTDGSVVQNDLVVNITGKKFIIVYDLKFTIKWRPYLGTEWFRENDWRTASWHMNKYGYYAYPNMVSTYNKVYCISN